MRDPELMLALLKAMSEDAEGCLHLVCRNENSDNKRYHHAELLVDAGHAAWRSPPTSTVRITFKGYDFLAERSGHDMRDTESMLALLKKMSEDIKGSLEVHRRYRKSYHHAELLADTGHVTWIGPAWARITNKGYDFLNATAILSPDKLRSPSTWTEPLPTSTPPLPAPSVKLNS